MTKQLTKSQKVDNNEKVKSLEVAESERKDKTCSQSVG